MSLFWNFSALYKIIICVHSTKFTLKLWFRVTSCTLIDINFVNIYGAAKYSIFLFFLNIYNEQDIVWHYYNYLITVLKT